MQNKKIVAFFVEGPTEIEFYKAVVKYAHDIMGIQLDCAFDWVNMRGIGNYKKDALRKFKTLQRNNPGAIIYVMLCIDTDVFEFSRKPPIDKIAVKASLEEEGAKKVVFIEAQYSIEDWFLSDFDGVISYLGLPKNTKHIKGKGQTVLKKLFKSANKVYVKGSNTENFIKSLDIGKIMRKNCASMAILCKTAGFDCGKVCNK